VHAALEPEELLPALDDAALDTLALLLVPVAEAEASMQVHVAVSHRSPPRVHGEQSHAPPEDVEGATEVEREVAVGGEWLAHPTNRISRGVLSALLIVWIVALRIHVMLASRESYTRPAMGASEVSAPFHTGRPDVDVE
jgi:hypothetical protein